MAVGEHTRQRGARAQRRVARAQEFVDAALAIAADEGMDALTMNRLATECDAAVSAVYRYFPSKGALVAKVQHGAIERLSDAYRSRRDAVDRQVSSADVASDARALVGVALVAAFFADAAEDFPMELRLLQLLMSDQRELVPVEEGMNNLPIAMSLLGDFQQAIVDAVAVDALQPGAEMERVITWAAAVSGVLEVNRLEVYDAELFDGTRLARQLSRDLLVGWGADGEALAAAELLVQESRGS